MSSDAATLPAIKRRTLKFRTFDEVLNEATRLSTQECHVLGNWSLGKALGHLGQAMHSSIDGIEGFDVPLKTKILGRLVFRHYVLHVKFPAGVRLPQRAAQALIPDQMEYADGMAKMKTGIERLAKETNRVPHPILGKFSVAQWNKFHLRHAELHLSFLVPK